MRKAVVIQPLTPLDLTIGWLMLLAAMWGIAP